MRRLLRDQSGRNDALDGLRAFAVAAVMAFHFGLPGATAGFLGVDVFFVLSGYLITRILLSQIQAGRLDLAGFWVRRIRRLAPALVVSVMAVIAWGALLAPAIVRDGLRSDITSTLAYVANWHFIESGSYFAAMGDESPLEHMWSLAVEEQFYLAWPIALFVLTRVVRPPRARIFAVGGLALTGILTSAWRLESIWSAAGPDRAYMGTDSRIFGPLVGALLAVVLTRHARIGSGRATNAVLLAIGGALVVWGMVSLGSSTGATSAYADGGALIVALGSAAVIWALATRASPATRFLGLLPVAYLGRLSYGIYIWHWPLILWSRENQWLDMSEWPTILRVPVLAALTVALASLSYHLVEKPIRYGKLAAHLSRRRTVIALPVALGLLVALNTMLVVPQAGAAEGDTTRTIMLVGDSVPQQLATEFSRAAASKGYVAILATRGGCPATGVMVVDTRGRPAGEGDACPRLVPQRQDDVTPAIPSRTGHLVESVRDRRSVGVRRYPPDGRHRCLLASAAEVVRGTDRGPDEVRGRRGHRADRALGQGDAHALLGLEVRPAPSPVDLRHRPTGHVERLPGRGSRALRALDLDQPLRVSRRREPVRRPPRRREPGPSRRHALLGRGRRHSGEADRDQGTPRGRSQVAREMRRERGAGRGARVAETHVNRSSLPDGDALAGIAR